jgi:hypothetical protein
MAEIWNEAPFVNSYLRPSFHGSLRAEEGLVALGSGIGPVVRDRNGAALFHLGWSTGVLPLSWSDELKIALVLVAALLLIAVCWLACDSLAAAYGAWAGALLFVMLIATLRYASLLLYPIAPFDRLPLFGPELYAASQWLPSLGDLLIDALLLLVIARYVHALLRDVGSMPRLHRPGRGQQR